MERTVYTGLFFLGLLQLAYGDSLIAWFDMSKLKGSIEFQKDVENTTIISNFEYDVEEMSASKNITKLKIFKQLPNLKKECETISTNFREYNITSNKTKVITEQLVSGANSLLGYTLAVYDIHNKILGCATLVTKNSSSQYATAYISNKNVGGKIDFLQNKFNDTVIFGEFQFVMDSVSSLSYHISNGSVYSKSGSCDVGLQMIDASGNLSAKLETLNITKTDTKQIFVSYPGLLLSDIIGKAFVISKDNKIIGCGNIYLRGPLQVQSSFRASEHKGISGYLKFTQVSPYHPTKLEVSLIGLDSRVKGYHVHQFPISDMKNPCSPDSVGGHLNPANVDPKKSPEPMKGTSNRYEIGDLSARYGFLENKPNYTLSVDDMNLPLYGPWTVVGRSVVIHENDAAATRFVCADIEPKGARKMSAKASFDKDPKYQGYVKAVQWRLANGLTTETIMQVHLSRTDSNVTRGHNWHIHQTKVDHKTEKGWCLSAKGHYNPFKINITNSKYKSLCSPSHPYSCEIGDTSAKTHTCDIDGKKRLFVDVMSPLFGNFTGMGRSITFHAENRGARRIACADFMPEPGKDIIFMEVHLKGKEKKGTHDFGTMLCEYLDIPPSDSWQMNSVQTQDSDKGNDCFKVSFYVLGESSRNHNYKQKIDDFQKGSKKLGGIIDPCPSTSPSGSGYIKYPTRFVVLVSLLVIWLS